MTLTRAQWVTLALLVLGIAHVALTVGLDRSTGYVLGWPLLVGAAFVAGFISPRHWAAWGVVALIPLAVATVLGDSVISVDDRGTGSITVFVVVVQALVATCASLMGAQLAQLGATRGLRSSSGRGVAVALALLANGVVVAALLRITTDAADNDPFESPLFWWVWIVLPLVAFGAGFVFPRLSAWWGFVVTAPIMVVVFVDGRVLYDGAGESFWIVAEVICLVLAAWATLFALGGAAVARRVDREAELEPARG